MEPSKIIFLQITSHLAFNQIHLLFYKYGYLAAIQQIAIMTNAC